MLLCQLKLHLIDHSGLKKAKSEDFLYEKASPTWRLQVGDLNTDEDEKEIIGSCFKPF